MDSLFEVGGGWREDETVRSIRAYEDCEQVRW